VLSEKDFPSLYTLGLRRLAKLLLDQGKLTESEELHQQAIEIFREKYVADSDSAKYDMTMTMYGSKFLYEAQGRCEETENVQRKVLEFFKARGKRDADFAMSMERLAEILSSQGKKTEGLELWREVFLSTLNRMALSIQ
jgi:tetratricopeptide (TPR) repeat protein